MTNSVKIQADIIDELSNIISTNHNKIIALVKDNFRELQEKYDRIHTLLMQRKIHFIAYIDVTVHNAKLNEELNHCVLQLVED